MTVRWDPNILRAAIAGARRGVQAGALLVSNEMVRLIRSPPKTGRLYQRRGRVHQASAPGEPPATDTGRLAKSIRAGRPEVAGMVVRCTVQVRAKYARALEYGTQRIAPRPYARVAVVNMRDRVVAVIRSEIAAAIAARSGSNRP